MKPMDNFYIIKDGKIIDDAISLIEARWLHKDYQERYNDPTITITTMPSKEQLDNYLNPPERSTK